ncbi:hypothetical protein PG993_006207 [Apiospora rasikravindrae]|uniref:Uncharacterized protein n=1 Tax=Apiospora rasikravindrae TaxID=990691 RepID=A0ABR1T515_9PEZI
MPSSSRRGGLTAWFSRSPYLPVPDQETNTDGAAAASKAFDSDNGDDPDKQEDLSLRDRSWVILRGLVPPFRVVLLLSVLFAGSLGLMFALTSPPAEDGGKQCGSSPDEARERGCLFEPQLSAWVPSQCGWRDVVDEFQEHFGDMHVEWPWFWDKNVTRRVLPGPEGVGRLQAGNFSVAYTTYHQSHDLHCLYCWRKVSYALEHGFGWMDARCHQFYHARHCVEHIGGSLVQGDDEEELQKWAYPLMYHDCFPIGSTTES